MPVSKMKMRKGKEMEIKSNGRADMFKDRGQDKVNSVSSILSAMPVFR